MCRMDQSSHQEQKGQLTGLVGPQALYYQALINKLNAETPPLLLLLNVHV